MDLEELMKQQLLHTPEGVRDIYNGECERKLVLQENLYNALKKYGYHSVHDIFPLRTNYHADIQHDKDLFVAP